MLAQVGNQGNVWNQNGNVVNENVQENIRNVLVNGNRIGCSYKEFLACNPKEYYGNGGIVVLTRWIKKMENVKLSCGITLWSGLAMLCILIGFMSWQATEPKTIQKAMQIFGALIDEAVRNESIKKVEKRENLGEPSKDKNGRDDNKRTRTGNAFASTANLVRRDNMGVPRNVNLVNVRNPTVRACYECGSIDHVRSACLRLNKAQGLRGNHQNQVVAYNRGQGHGNQENQARGRAFMFRAEEAR
nr:reverse transcriptase domain-containing protein [Tanacetum cinerariifolium]